MSTITKRTWAGLVRYANGAVTEPSEIRRIIADCMPWVAAIEPFGLLNRILWGDEELIREAAIYRPSIDGLLRWFCSANSEERITVGLPVISFLREHTEHIGGMRLKEVCYIPEDVEKFNYTPAELSRMKEETDRYWADHENSPLGILTPTKEYEDIADPICDFVLSEYQKHRSKEYSKARTKLGPAVPIFICQNPHCKKLVMPERTGRKKYCSDCSDRARTEKYRQKASPDENRDYQWLYRLKQLKSDVRKIRLRNSKVRERLNEVKARQRNSSRCQSLLQDMRL